LVFLELSSDTTYLIDTIGPSKKKKWFYGEYIKLNSQSNGVKNKVFVGSAATGKMVMKS